MRRAAPRPLGRSIEALRAALAPVSPLGRVQTVWDGAVGAKIAAAASPVALIDGALTVECSGSVWSAELTMMSSEICDRINAAIAETPGSGSTELVVELRCRTR